jgi:hypothetical protein
MNPGRLVLAKGNTSQRAQFAAMVTSEALDITAPTLLNATKSMYVRLNPTSGDVYYSVEPTAVLSAVGTFLGSVEAIIVPAGHYFGATGAVNVTPIGYGPLA